jgi:lysozyme family protein
MSDFAIAVFNTLINEGGFVDNPADPGGRTNFGITQRDLVLTMPGKDVATLTAADASQWYETTTQPQRYNNPLYWDIESQGVASKVFDLGVLFGVGTVVQFLQGILKLKVDGNFGPVSLAAVNGAEPFSLLTAIKTVLVQHALDIGAERPAERQFVTGWIRRINL